MYKPLSLFIGLRYTRAKMRNQFISLISLISMLGIALGVVVLITVLSVLNGFDREIKKQLFGMVSPITIGSYLGRVENWHAIEDIARRSPQVTAIAPFASGETLLSSSGMTAPAMLSGVLPAQEKQVSVLATSMQKGSLDDLVPGQYGIILGETLANRLNVNVGDEITVATPATNHRKLDMHRGLVPKHIMSRMKRFHVVGISHMGGGAMGFDSHYAFVHLADAQQLFVMGNAVSALHVNIKDVYAAPSVAHNLQLQMPATERVGNWTEQLGEFFENIRITKTMMFFIFIMIIAVAVFNLICTMVMIVKNKRADIAILRTMGATPRVILAIFVVQGVAIGLGGTLLGIIGGVTLAHYVPTVSIFLQHLLHLQLVSADVYFVDYLPSELQWPDIWHIGLIALALSAMATLYPAWRASRITPVEALRDN